jgi:2-dehydro-3-deoxyphosphogluconate aldolase/(4S)-4-hydroxy-2-oxoglutarate aldolase
MDKSWDLHPLMPLVSLRASDDPVAVAKAVEDGGVNTLEIAFRTDYAAEAIRLVRTHTSLRVIAGTVQSREEVDQAMTAGAHAGVSPHLDSDVLRYCQEQDFPFAPGIASPSEAAAALRLGATIVKVFPAKQLGGPEFLRALSDVYPDARFVVSGGVSLASLADYLAIEAVVSVSGSWMTPSASIASRDYAKISARVAEAREVVASCR